MQETTSILFIGMCGINAHELLNDGVSVDASFLQQKVLRYTVVVKDTTRYSRYIAHKAVGGQVPLLLQRRLTVYRSAVIVRYTNFCKGCGPLHGALTAGHAEVTLRVKGTHTHVIQYQRQVEKEI